MEISATKPIRNTIYLGNIEANNNLTKILKSQKLTRDLRGGAYELSSKNKSELIRLIEKLSLKKEINKSFVSIVNVPKGANEIASKIVNSEDSSETADAWNKLVNIAIDANQGTGSPESGYLVFSEEHGFVNYLNPELSIEENKVIASKSLEAQISIESIEREINNDTITQYNPEAKAPEIKKEKRGFVDKVKDIFSFASKAVNKLRDVIKSASKIKDKIEDFSKHLKASDFSFVKKIGGYIDKGLSFISKWFT